MHARAAIFRHIDLLLFGVVILIANLALLAGGTPAARYSFVPSLVAQGEWWRVPGHLFAHISFYHLLLDAGAFLLLYHGLKELSMGQRLAVVVGGAVGSLVREVANALGGHCSTTDGLLTFLGGAK